MRAPSIGATLGIMERVMIDFANRHVPKPGVITEVLAVEEAAYRDIFCLSTEKDQVEPQFAVLCVQMPMVIPPFGLLVVAYCDDGIGRRQGSVVRLIQPRLISEPLNRTMIRKTFFSRQVIFPVSRSM